jgi:hypothetical protein
MAAHLCLLACGRLGRPNCFQRGLHLRDVLLHLVQIDAERGGVELSFRDAGLDRAPSRDFHHGPHLGRGVAPDGFRDPDERVAAAPLCGVDAATARHSGALPRLARVSGSSSAPIDWWGQPGVWQEAFLSARRSADSRVSP